MIKKKIGIMVYNFYNLLLKISIISLVIVSRSYFGFQFHSSLAKESSIVLGQESAIACLKSGL